MSLVLRSLWSVALVVIATTLPARAQTPDPFAGRTVLVMVDDTNCGWCRKWDREVGVGYGRSEEGKRAPLIKILRGDRRLKRYPGLAYTPTFLLLVNGEERGRIVGFQGVDFFWGELGRLLQKAPAMPEVRAEPARVLAL